MKITKYLSLAPALAVLATTPLMAQDERGTAEEKEPQAEELPLPTYVRAPIGAKAIITNKDKQRLGVVRDHVIDRRAGKVLFVAVGSDDKKDEPARLVPYDRFTWNDVEQRLVLPMTMAMFTALPEYDPKKLPSIPGRVTDGKPEASDVEDVTVGRDKPAGEVRNASARMNHTTLAASNLLGSEVMAVRDRFATTRGLILEPNQGTIAFVIAASDANKDDPYIIPWRAMTWQVPEKKDMPGHFALTLTKDDLAKAPTLKRADIEHLNKDRKAVEGIFGFYKLIQPIAKDKSDANG